MNETEEIIKNWIKTLTELEKIAKEAEKKKLLNNMIKTMNKEESINFPLSVY